MLKILAALVLGVAILLPAAAAFAREDGVDGADHYAAPVQIEINPAPAEPSVTLPVDTSRE